MPIYRGEGGSGDASTDAYASQIAVYAQTATTKANEASASATAAAASATAAAASESAVDADAIAAEAAKVAAEAAQAAAELAENNAETAENNAETAETNAAASASAASTSASSASTSATNAASSATSASSSASSASTSATNASNSASAASTSESNAATSASNAATSETNAATSASNASTSASNASTSATNASNSATAAAASAAAAAATAASIGDLDSLSDVTVTTPSTGQVLKYNGSVWVNDTDAGGLADIVEDTTPQLGGTLDANGNTIDMGTNEITDTKVGQWDTAYGWGDHSTAGYLTGITGQSINNLSDVYSSMSPVDGQVLTYDTTNGWQAETSSSPNPDAIPKAWAAVNMSTGLLDSYNVSSGSFSSGDFYLFWDVDMSDTDYAIVTGHQQNNGTTIQFGVLTGSIAVGSARFLAYSNGSSTNLSRCYVAVYDT